VSDVTRLLQAAEQGDGKAAGELLPLVYEELRWLAAQMLAGESPGQTLQPTALVHEALRKVHGEADGFFETATLCPSSQTGSEPTRVTTLGGTGRAGSASRRVPGHSLTPMQ